MSDRIKAIVVGVRGIGVNHAKLLAEHKDFDLVALCDLNPEALANPEVRDLGAQGFTDLQEALATTQPDLMVVATNNVSHAAVAQQGIEGGIKALYCEKPMTVDWGDALRMTEMCRDKGVTFVVNHQRRLLPLMKRFRDLIEQGAVGQIELLRASNGGDVLSDGTHAIDSLRFLAGDKPVDWVAGQVFRQPYENSEEGAGFKAAEGRRFGHVVEDGAMAVIQFKDGPRAELFCGHMFPEGRWYQDYEAIGRDGRIHRPSDGKPEPFEIQTDGKWSPIEVEGTALSALTQSYDLLARSMRDGSPHPLDGATQGLEAMRILTAIYESARTHQRVDPAKLPDQFPLQRMVDEGAFREVGS